MKMMRQCLGAAAAISLAACNLDLQNPNQPTTEQVTTSPDGVIEGIEDPTLPLWLGVQWHPERLHAEADHLALFKLLVEKARQG